MRVRYLIKSIGGDVTIRNDSGKPVPIIANIPLAVNIGKIMAIVNFLVAKQLDTEVILFYDYRNRYVEVIRPRGHIVEMDNR